MAWHRVVTLVPDARFGAATGAFPGVDGLILLRKTILSFSTALVLFGVFLAVMDVPNGSVMPWLGVLAACAIASVVLTRVVDKPLDCTSASTLAGTYRTRFFLRVAFAESVALFGFAFVFIGAPRWLYYLGAAFALVRFWTIAAPTRAAVGRDQQALRRRGCELSLVAVLRGPRPTSDPAA